MDCQLCKNSGWVYAIAFTNIFKEPTKTSFTVEQVITRCPGCQLEKLKAQCEAAPKMEGVE